ncbi:MAG: hypothetical protein ACW99Q_11180 [Candidatus Kariarchaeaceae archaeon]
MVSLNFFVSQEILTLRSFLGRDILTLEDMERNEIFHILLSVAQELDIRP